MSHHCVLMSCCEAAPCIAVLHVAEDYPHFAAGSSYIFSREVAPLLWGGRGVQQLL